MMMNKVQIKEKIAQLREQFPLHVAVFENDTQVSFATSVLVNIIAYRANMGQTNFINWMPF